MSSAGRCLLLLLCAVAACAPRRLAQPDSPGSGLVGAWQASEIVKVGEGGGSIYEQPPRVGPAGPGMRLYTAGHFSYFGLNNTAISRPALPASAPTVEQLLAIWGPVGANGGSYVVRGDTIIETHAVAKNPTGMPNRVTSFLFRIAGDSLWTTNLRNGNVVKYVRLE
jgi:hypothetical protein